MSARAGRLLTTGPVVLAASLLCALLLALPGETVITRYLPDLVTILDGAWRVAHGQAPSVDFHAATGPLAHYLPAAGYGLTGSLGAAMPAAMALATLALAPAIAHVLASRLSPAVAIPFGLFLVLVLAVPINLGEGVTSLSFIAFYNRIGWAALAALLVMHLAPRAGLPRRTALDAGAAAFLVLVMLYTKATYGLAALAFLGLMLTARDGRRWAAPALGIVAAGILAAELAWGGTGPYVADLLRAQAVDGSPRGSWGQILDHALGNLTDFILLALLAGLSLRRTRSARDLAFYLFCAASGFALINQNFQAWGVLTLHAAGAVAAEGLLRADAREPAPPGPLGSLPAGVKLLFLAFVLPTIVHNATALGLHAGAAVARAGEPVDLPNLERVRLVSLMTWGDRDATADWAAKAREGLAAIEALPGARAPVVALDFANPFALAAAPPRGGAPSLRWGRILDAAHPLPAESLLADARVVMEPKAEPGAPVDLGGAMRDAYAATLTDRFEPAGETARWRLHRRREAPGRTSRLDLAPQAAAEAAR